MFGSDKNKARRTAGSSVETLIGPRVVIRGDICFSGGLYLEGTVYGSVMAEENNGGVLTIAESGVLEGEVHAPHVIVSGTLRGDVYANERIELAAHARVQGNVHYKLVEMTAGAMITGRLIHTAVPIKQLPNPESIVEQEIKALAGATT